MYSCPWQDYNMSRKRPQLYVLHRLDFWLLRDSSATRSNQGEPAQAFTKLFLVLIWNKADIIWEKEMATHSSILAWRIDRGGWVGCRLWGRTELDTAGET